ncbi:hypothetical protein N7517_001951 [Penicillium concentricum]|uniref:Uncharacterized protein n=1 Tax=Penicillium concentricum TaxID=293559 RepID=A0A9W9VL71_9EURO|nr:uncharacterized protein N7517_001951 [Penicillium concentricum]KAJ5384040.1 hypothetical protein N7517_001951 [Penicillium concentricum]
MSEKKKQQRAKKRRSKEHSRRVREREEELRRRPREKVPFFLGSPFKTYEVNYRGPAAGV